MFTGEDKPWTRHADFRSDPEMNPLGTPSGLIEIFSRKIAQFNYDDCPGHPTWMEKAERSHGGQVLTSTQCGCNLATLINACIRKCVNHSNIVKHTRFKAESLCT